MKRNTLIITSVLLVLLMSCKNKEERLTVEPNEIDYLNREQVDEMPRIIDEKIKDFKIKVTSFFNENNINHSARKEIFAFFYKVFLTEDGTVVKIVNINLEDVRESRRRMIQETKNKPSYKMLDSLIREKFSHLKFQAALRNGDPVSYTDIFTVYVMISEDENIHVSDPYPDFDVTPKAEDGYYMALEKMPVPVGGIKAIQANLTYPEIAKRAGIEGKIFVKVYIDEKGNVEKSEIIKGIGAGLDEAAIYAISQTKFNPGILKDIPVKVVMVIPIVFKIKKETSADK